MSFLNLGWPLVLLGLGGLAAGLYALQRLRVRHRQVPVVTTLFWKEAVEESRARVLTKRFRHPWAYALILLIAALMWLGLAAPEVEWDEPTVIVLDGSARMARTGVFERAKEVTLAEAAAIGRTRRTVIFAGAEPRRVLVPGEDLLLLERRLDGLAPDACTSTLRSVQASLAPADTLGPRVRIVTDDLAWSDYAGPGRFSIVDLGMEASANGGIVALGISGAASGRHDAVDVFVEVARSNSAVHLSMDPAPAAAPTRDEQTLPDGVRQVWYRDVPARGQRLRVEIDADSLTLDDHAEIVLPTRRVHAVSVDADLLAIVGPLIDADPALTRDDTNPLQPGPIVSRERFREGLPRLVFVPEADDVPMLTIVHPDAEARGEALLAEAYEVLGLGEIDAVALADASGRPVEVRVEQGPSRQIEIWDSLATDRYDLIHTRTFPALLARALRYLVDEEPLQRTVGAGEPLDAGEFLRDADGRTLDPVGAPAMLPRAGAHRTTDGTTLIASLVDPALVAQAGQGDVPTVSPASGAGGSSWTWLLALAFMLLLAEWLLFRTERIP